MTMEYDHRIRSEQGMQMLNQVRNLCADLPEVEEAVDGFGCTTFRVKGKSFIRMSESEQGGLRLTFKSNLENQEILIQGNRYEKAPYIGHHGWVAVKEGVPLHWGELGELLKEAYLRTAPKRLVKQYLG